MNNTQNITSFIELYLKYEQKWQEEEFGVCDCPMEIDDDYPFPCKHMPPDEIFTEWNTESESRFRNLLKLMTILN